MYNSSGTTTPTDLCKEYRCNLEYSTLLSKTLPNHQRPNDTSLRRPSTITPVTLSKSLSEHALRCQCPLTSSKSMLPPTSSSLPVQSALTSSTASNTGPEFSPPRKRKKKRNKSRNEVKHNGGRQDSFPHLVPGTRTESSGAPTRVLGKKLRPSISLDGGAKTTLWYYLMWSPRGEVVKRRETVIAG